MDNYPDWTDPRLGQAYDLLDAVVDSLHPKSDEYQDAKRIRNMIEALDCDLEGDK